MTTILNMGSMDDVPITSSAAYAPQGEDDRLLPGSYAALSILVQEVIDRELPPQEQRVIRGRYFENRTCTQIAQEMGVHKSTVGRLQERAEARIRQALQYVMLYRQRLLAVEDEISVQEILDLAGRSNQTPCFTGERLRQLRQECGLSIALLGQLTHISYYDLSAMEDNQMPLTGVQAVRLARVLDTTTDYLLGLGQKKHK